MPVLLLCQGDAEAKNRLRRAIEARYGINPPAIEKISMSFRGRAHTKIGPVKTWIPVEAKASFVFPTHLRWEFAVKPMNLPVQKGIETYDGKMYRSQKAIGANKESVKTDFISSARGRLWQMAAILHTPMSDYYIKVSSCGSDCIIAENTKLNDAVHIYLRQNDTMDYAAVRCFNPEKEREQKLFLRLSEEIRNVNGMMMPSQVSAFWDDEPYFEMEPIHVDTNPKLPDDTFTLGQPIINGAT
jgi:hypothetical protein